MPLQNYQRWCQASFSSKILKIRGATTEKVLSLFTTGQISDYLKDLKDYEEQDVLACSLGNGIKGNVDYLNEGKEHFVMSLI